MMATIKYIIFLVCALFSIGGYAQKTDSDYIRKGNKYYKDSLFIKAEVEYRKALDINPTSTEASYNLGNSLLMQEKAKEAIEQYVISAKKETDKQRLAQIYHNIGVVLQAGKQYQQCIETYKKSLRNNPKDNETRYNLALAQKMLEEQQDENQEQQNEDEQQQNEEQQEQDKNKENQQNDQEQQNNSDNQEQEQNQLQENQMSEDNAQQLLNAVMQDEKDVQDKIKKRLQQEIQERKLDKDW